MNPIHVAVTGINAIDNPGPGVAVARSLREDPNLDVRIHGLAYDAMEPGIYMDWLFDKSFLLPSPANGTEEFVDRLISIKERHGLDVVIPNLDAELPTFIRARQTLADHGIRCMVPTYEQFQLRAKDHLPDVAEEIEIDVPETIVVRSLDQLYAAIDKIGCPVMIKGLFYDAQLATSMAEAFAAYHRIVMEWGYPVLVQQVVTGEHLNVVGLGDGTGQHAGLVGIRKLVLTKLGKVWTGVTIRHEPMLEAAARFIERYRWRGPFELECIVNGDRVYLIEINPRFPAWVYLSSGVGVNLPARLLRYCLDMPVPNGWAYRPGMLFVRYSSDLVTDMSSFQSLITMGEYA